MFLILLFSTGIVSVKHSFILQLTQGVPCPGSRTAWIWVSNIKFKTNGIKIKMHNVLIQSDTILGSNNTGSWRWITNDTCISADDCLIPVAFSCWCVLSWAPTTEQCSREASGCEADGSICVCLIMNELSGMGEPADVPEDLLRSGTVAMDTVSLWESSTASHCPQHAVSAPCLQLRNFLFNSVFTCTQNKGVSLQS